MAGALVQGGRHLDERMHERAVAEVAADAVPVVDHLMGVAARHLGGERIDRVRRPAERLRRLPQGRAQAVGHDRRRHGRLLDPEPFFHPLDDLVAALRVEVDVNVGRSLAAPVQEAFEQEVVFDRVDACDAEQVGDDRVSCRAAPGAPDAAPPGFLDDLADDEEEVFELQVVNGGELVSDLGARLGAAAGGVLVAKAFPAEVAELLRRGAVGVVAGVGGAEGVGKKVDRAGPGDVGGPVPGRRIRDQAPHRGFGAKKGLRIVRPGGVGIEDGDPFPDAGEEVVARLVASPGVADVAGGGEGNAGPLREPLQLAHPRFVSRRQVVGDLQGEPIPEDALQAADPLCGGFRAPVVDEAPEAAPRRSGEAKEVAAVLAQFAEGGQGGVPVAQVCFGENPAEVCVARPRGCQKDERRPGRRSLPRRSGRRFVADLRPRNHVDLRTDNRRHARLPAGLLEADGPVDAVPVRQREGGNPQVGRPLRQIGGRGSAALKRKPASHVQVRQHGAQREGKQPAQVQSRWRARVHREPDRYTSTTPRSVSTR